MSRRLSCAVLAALLAPIISTDRPAFASATAGGGTAALAPITSAIASGFVVAPADERPVPVTEPDPPGLLASRYVSGTRYEASSYRPRQEPSHGRWRPVSQFHAGFLDSEGPSDPGFLAGFRTGQRIHDMFEIGLGLDWEYESGSSFETGRMAMGPGSGSAYIWWESSHYSSHLFPALLYLQVSGPPHLTLVPYAGVAASWQVLFLDADDYTTGLTYEATFDGFGWQLWGGVALPLSGRSRLTGEVFMNQAELDHDVYDPFYGYHVRETVNADGVGGRFGISWGF